MKMNKKMNRSGSTKDEAVKNLMKKNRNKVMSTENLAEKAGNIAGKKNAKIILRDLAIENLYNICKVKAIQNDWEFISEKADLVLLDAKNLDYFIYHYGINHTKAVFKNGKLVVNNKTLVKE